MEKIFGKNKRVHLDTHTSVSALGEHSFYAVNRRGKFINKIRIRTRLEGHDFYTELPIPPEFELRRIHDRENFLKSSIDSYQNSVNARKKFSHIKNLVIPIDSVSDELKKVELENEVKYRIVKRSLPAGSHSIFGVWNHAKNHSFPYSKKELLTALSIMEKFAEAEKKQNFYNNDVNTTNVFLHRNSLGEVGVTIIDWELASKSGRSSKKDSAFKFLKKTINLTTKN